MKPTCKDRFIRKVRLVKKLNTLNLVLNRGIKSFTAKLVLISGYYNIINIIFSLKVVCLVNRVKKS